MYSILRKAETEISVEELIEKVIPSLRRRFLETMQLAKDYLDLEELADLLRAGRIEQAASLLDNAILGFTQSLNIVFIEAGSFVAGILQDSLRVNISFDQVNEEAVETMRQNNLRLIREFREEQRIAVRIAMDEAIQQGLNPLEQARRFRDTVGLTSYQERIIINYRRQLEELDNRLFDRILRDKRFDSTVRRAIRDNTRLSQEQIDLMVRRYRERWIKYRAEMIARTEAMYAANAGSWTMFNQSVDSGILLAEDLIHSWLITRDPKVRDSHGVMQGQQIVHGGTFLTGNGNRARFPGDPLLPASDRIHCRCTSTTRIRAL